MSKEIKNIIFDLGGVLIDWNPRYVYRDIFKTDKEIDWFFDNVCTADWNEEQDAGRLLSVATEELVETHKEWEKEIRAFYDRWEEMLGGPIQETVDIFRELKESGRFKFYALTNWSGETFPVALRKFDFLHWFDGRLVSGDEKMRKPFPEFYKLLLDRFQLDAGSALFIDDNMRNIEAAKKIGIESIRFRNAGELREQLADLHII
ncbi:MAG: HAD family phosphatase [Gemmatimonadaceae bacterium]|nr:HAD family phosphatase [Chitinophagaceae bacterium]